MRFLLIFCLLTVTSVRALRVKFLDCGSKNVEYVDITPCTTEPCPFPTGTTMHVEVGFTIGSKTTKAPARAYGIIDGQKVPFPGSIPDGCTTGLKCPTNPGDKEVYHSAIEIKTWYPKIALVVQYELLGDAEQTLFCFKVPAHVTSPRDPKMAATRMLENLDIEEGPIQVEEAQPFRQKSIRNRLDQIRIPV